MAHQLTWYGHSAFKLVTDDGVTIFFDPFLTGNPANPVDVDQATDKADLVLLTHDHGDHLGDSMEICEKTGAKLVTIFDIAGALVEEGLPQEQAVGMNIGGTVTECGIAITQVEAVHSSTTGSPCGFILKLPDGFTLYYAGDTALFASMGLFPLFHDIDHALLPTGGHFTMDAPQAAEACKMIGCDTVTPMHYGTFPILKQGTEEFARELTERSPETKLVAMNPGETISLG